LAMLIGPSVAGISMTAIVSGRAGMQRYAKRLRRWRVPARFYAVALLVAPLTLLMTVAALSAFSPAFVPALLGGSTAAIGPAKAASTSAFLAMGLGVGLGAGFFEELGWTGFAAPLLRERLGNFRAGLLIGLLWGAWHFLAVFWGSAEVFGSVPIPLYLLVALFAFLPSYRVLMVELYDRTHSTLLGMLMHASLTTSMILLGPVVSGGAAMAYNLAFGAALWLLALAGAGLMASESRARPV
jgi:membrane protease YdiL (CAAX protease family)